MPVSRSTVQEGQKALIKLGYDLGKFGADGDLGSFTERALRKFQDDKNLPLTATFDVKTLEALGLGDDAKDEKYIPPWLESMMGYKGIHEVPGKRDNPKILDMADNLSPAVQKFYTDDEIPWCGLILAHTMKKGAPNEPQPAWPLAALNWATFGRALTKPIVGCVMVYRRKGGGHVGYFWGEDKTHYYIWGGNQSNTVSIMRIPKSGGNLKLEAMRWPEGVPLPNNGGTTKEVTLENADTTGQVV